VAASGSAVPPCRAAVRVAAVKGSAVVVAPERMHRFQAELTSFVGRAGVVDCSLLAQAPWWQLRGRLTSQVPLLVAAAEYAAAGSDGWRAARMCLGQAASQAADPAGGTGAFHRGP
jgi:hypothetical protein